VIFNNKRHTHTWHKPPITIVHAPPATKGNNHQPRLWPPSSVYADYSSVAMSNDLNRLQLLESVFNRVTEFARTVHSILPTIRECNELHERLLDSIGRILSLLRLIRDGLIGHTSGLTNGRSKG